MGKQHIHTGVFSSTFLPPLSSGSISIRIRLNLNFILDIFVWLTKKGDPDI